MSLFYETRSVQFISVTQSCPILCDPMNRSTPGLPVHHQLPEFTHTHVIESVMPSSHLILFRPLLLLPSIFPSIRVFSNESSLRIRTLKSLLQHHSSKASILRRSAFFTIQLSHPYMTNGKTIALTRWTSSPCVKYALIAHVPNRQLDL